MIEAPCLTGTSLIQDNPLPPRYAEVAKLADALDSGSSARKGVRVQIPPSAPHETSMPFTRLPFRRFPVQCTVTYGTGIQGHGTVRNLCCTGGRLSNDPPARLGEPIRLPNKQRIDIPKTVVLW